MKKLYCLIILTVILCLVLTGCFLSNVGQVPTTEQSGVSYLTKHTEGEPFESILWAGQDINVGVMKVWNDAENLYITYVINAPQWFLTETHLHVACDESAIPQNKKGNPIPGHFDYSSEHEIVDYVTEYPLDPIPLSSIDCCITFIAAHAVVVHVADEVCDDLYSDATETFSAHAGSTCVDTSTRTGTATLAWEPYNDPTPSVWDNGVDYAFTNADWIWEAYRVVNPVCGDVVDFTKTFEIPGLYLVDASVEMHVTCDNGYEFLVNGESQGSAQLSAGWETSDLTQLFVDTNTWQSVESYYGFADDLKLGSNTLLFKAANEYMGSLDGQGTGTDYSNPGGLIYEGQVCYTVVDQEETAWGFGTRFVEQGNWGMYFNYTVQCPPPELINGSFEYPVVGTDPGWDIFDSEYDEFFGWTVEWAADYGSNAPIPAHLELHSSSVLGVTPPDGDQYAELDTDWQGPSGPSGEPASVEISQMINTCDCASYQVTFYYLPRSGASDNGLDVHWDGDVKFSVTNPSNTDWIEVIISDLPGAPGETESELMFIETGTADSLGMFLDDVSVEFYVAP